MAKGLEGLVLGSVLILGGMTAGAAEPAGKKLAVGPVGCSSSEVRCHELLELTFSVQGPFDNPFDPRQIEVDGVFRSPAGKELTVPGFLYRQYGRKLESGRELIEPAGEPVWKVRFSPTEAGRWTGRVVAKDAKDTVETPFQAFLATSSQGHGYVRRSDDPRYFRHDDGTPFFGIGENIAWAGRQGTYDFDAWLTKAAAAKMNLARIWLQWNQTLSIEHKGAGAGRYDLGNAWRMDHVLDLSRRLGVRVLFCCDSPEPYQKVHVWEGHRSSPWNDCPHNVANGGPLKEPEEFYTTEEGRRLIRQRLRYIVARWGWDPNIFCWELWNEMNCFPDWQKWMPQTVSWHLEMAALVRKLDLGRHLVTTSFGFSKMMPAADAIWRLSELDFVQTHAYGGRDGLKHIGQALPEVQREMARRYPRPHIVGEFGCHVAFHGERLNWDPDGLYLHNGLWASALSGSAATALTWWWDNFVDGKNQYHHFSSIARFCQDVPWPTAGFRDADAAFDWRGPRPAPRKSAAVLEPQSSWDIAENHFSVRRDGTLHGGQLSSYLHGSNHAKRRKPLVLAVDYAHPGKLVVLVEKVSVLGILEIRCDGQIVLRQELPAGPGTGPWKKSRLDDWKCWEATYDREFAIDVPAGKHEIQLDNLGKDAIVLGRITLPDYAEHVGPPLRCVGLVGRELAVLWIQNTGHEWNLRRDGQPLDPAENAEMTVRGTPNDVCRVEWWDTWEGKVTQVTEARSQDSRLILPLPTITKDLACKISWPAGPRK